MDTRQTDQIFLFVYDRKNNRQVHVIPFGDDYTAAFAECIQQERKYVDQPWMDVVLIGSDSLDTIKITHSTYFQEGVNRLLNLAEH
ncbi:MAG: hypothetical protein Q4P71_09065 [Actinomycetaceae bacterium]|nr:hypothetical protein [Actinomycetaceae bacterium]